MRNQRDLDLILTNYRIAVIIHSIVTIKLTFIIEYLSNGKENNMAIPYIIYPRKVNINGERVIYTPKAVRNNNIGTWDLARQIARESSLTVGDVYNALMCMGDDIQQWLLLGSSVTLDKIGTFSSELRVDKGTAFSKGEDVDLSHVHGAIARFRADVALRKALEDARIEKYKVRGGENPA